MPLRCTGCHSLEVAWALRFNPPAYWDRPVVEGKGLWGTDWHYCDKCHTDLTVYRRWADMADRIKSERRIDR